MYYPLHVPESHRFAVGHEAFGLVPGLMMYATLWLREHNRVCDILRQEHPDWDDERLFQTTRLILIGEGTSIQRDEWNVFSVLNGNYNFILWKKYVWLNFSAILTFTSLSADKALLSNHHISFMYVLHKKLYSHSHLSAFFMLYQEDLVCQVIFLETLFKNSCHSFL